MTSNKVAVTGIQATGTPHLGNYVGAIRPALSLAGAYESLYFIADYHALNSIRDPLEPGSELDGILEAGAQRARERARPVLAAVRKAVGLG